MQAGESGRMLRAFYVCVHGLAHPSSVEWPLPSEARMDGFLSRAVFFTGRLLLFLFCAGSALSASLLLFLGKDKIGGTPIAPGFDTGFTWKTKLTPDKKALVLRTHEGGDLICWLRLKPVHSIPEKAVLNASVGGRALIVTRCKDEDFPDWIDVYELEKLPEGRGKFKWPNGHSVEISCVRDATNSLELTDWLIYLDKDHDSLSASNRRWWLFWGSVLALFLSFPATLYTGWNILARKDERATQVVTSQSIVISVIDAISLDDKTREIKMKTLLSQILIQGLSVNVALSSMMFEDGYAKFAFWFDARRQFRERLTVIIHELVDYLNKTSGT